MGKQRTCRHHALVRIRIAIIQGDLLAIGQKQSANHGPHEHRLTSIVDWSGRELTCKADVRQELGVQQLTNIGALVLLVRAIL